jgi:nitric oxide dioxygenase
VLRAQVHHKHCALNVLPEQYDVVGEHILGTIVDLLDPGQDVLDAWGALYGGLAAACVGRSEELYAAMEAKAGGWRGTRGFRVARKTPLSATVCEFDFAPLDGKPIASFLPGQYTTVHAPPGPTVGEYAQPRHYTLVQHPSQNDGEYSIAVKRQAAGQVSKWLHDDVLEGDTVLLSPPFGDRPRENQPVSRRRRRGDGVGRLKLVLAQATSTSRTPRRSGSTTRRHR